MNLGKFFRPTMGLLTIVACTTFSHAHEQISHSQSKDHNRQQKHHLHDAIINEIDALKTKNPQQTYFFITDQATPSLYAFLSRTIQTFCATENIEPQPKLILAVHPLQPDKNINNYKAYDEKCLAYQARSSGKAIILGENMLRLLLAKERMAAGIFSFVAHELGHIFYDIQKDFEKGKSEVLADEFAIHLTKNADQFASAFTMVILAFYLFQTLYNPPGEPHHMHEQKIAPIVIQIIHAFFPIVQEKITPLIGNNIPDDQLFKELFEDAYKLLKKPIDATSLAQELIQALSTLCSSQAEVKKRINNNTPQKSFWDYVIKTKETPNPAVHPPVYERIRHARTLC